MCVQGVLPTYLGVSSVSFGAIIGSLVGFVLFYGTPNVTDADEARIRRTADDLIPDVPVLFWSFRFMAGLGFYFIALFAGRFTSPQCDGSRSAGSCGSRSGACRFPGSPPSSAGSSPSTAASLVATSTRNMAM
jgi:hypothetical protein